MTINFTMELDPAAGGDSCHGQARIMRNNVSIWDGVDNALAAAGPTVYTDANIVLNLLAGDCIEVWGHVAVGGGETCRISQLEICFDATITGVSRYDLSVPLALSVSGIVYEDVQ
jgi:hypothetical protein